MDPLADIGHPAMYTRDTVKLHHILNRIIDQYEIIVSDICDQRQVEYILHKQKNMLFYIARNWNEFTIEDFMGILIYMERLRTIWNETYLNRQNMSYILLVIIVLYAKMYHDDVYDNVYYCQATKTDLEIFNYTERMIFRSLRMVITAKQLQDLELEIENEISSR